MEGHEWNEIQAAARAIMEANFMLVGSGAGLSADSGLPVFKDIARVDTYTKRNLSYAALCNPQWNFEDPELFYGFFGSTLNSYRRSAPHQGYNILKKWKDQFFSSSSPIYEQIQETLSKYPGVEGEGALGPFFVYTSNIDGFHFRSGLEASEIYEIHGTMEKWQCSDMCSTEVWDAPSDFVFNVDMNTMLASNTEETLDHTQNNGFVGNHPRCKFCGGPARPSILMFGDFKWARNSKLPWQEWRRGLEEMMNHDKNLKLVVLEIGCGLSVPTVRYMSESRLEQFGPSQCTVIRINVDFPYAGRESSCIFDNPSGMISIQSSGLAALLAIDEAIANLQKEDQDNPKRE